MQLPTLIENSSNDGTDNDLMVPRISVLKCKISVEEGKIDLIQKWPFMQLSSRPEFNIHKNKMAQFITNKMILKSTNDLIREDWRQLVCKKKVPIPYFPFFCVSSAFPSARFAGGAFFPEKLKRNVAFCQSFLFEVFLCPVPNNCNPTKHYL